jgi:hypothetical protein
MLISCSKEQEDTNRSKIIAKAGEENLYADDIKDNFAVEGTVKDSAFRMKRLIDGWATDALFYQEALAKLDKEDIQIEKQVEAYRRDLVNYIYSNRIIEANLDTAISYAEIEAYYNTHRDNFILKENIVKVNYIKVPVKAPGLDKIKRLAMMGTVAEAQQLRTLCVQHAENFFLNDSTWLYVDEIRKEIPGLKDEPDFNFSSGRVIQFTDDVYYYYLKIKDVKVKNGLSPINFERQNIKKFIINNRKTQLIMQYKQLKLEKARSNKTYVMY